MRKTSLANCGANGPRTEKRAMRRESVVSVIDSQRDFFALTKASVCPIERARIGFFPWHGH